MQEKTLIVGIELLSSMDESLGEIKDAAILVSEKKILAVGKQKELKTQLEGQEFEVIDLRGCVVIPGLINTHHHMYQSLTRVLPGAQDKELFGWLKTLYPVWGRMTPDMIRDAGLTAMAELILSGCTTSSDHLYLFPNGSRLDDTIEAAATIGMRFTATRGSMSVGVSKGGLPPDELTEKEDSILKDSRRIIEAWNDPSSEAMIRVALAPCSPFSVSRDLMKETALLARSSGVGLHTHLAENDNDVAYSREKFGMTPAEYAESLGWIGQDVWHAHCVKLDDAGIALFGRSKTGVAHCPCSNMRLGSGIAPVRKMLEEGVNVGLGVDGSASNDGGNLLGEARTAMLCARVLEQNPGALSARKALEIATVGGAKVLNRPNLGKIAPGYMADIAAFRLDGLVFAGAHADPLAALVFCDPPKADFVMINGKTVVRDGRLLTLDIPKHVEKIRRHLYSLLS